MENNSSVGGALLRFKSEEEAQKRAKDDLRALLKSSGARLNCKTLHTLIEESERKKDEVDRELIFNIQKKVQEISNGVQMLSEKEEVTKDIRLKITSIKDIWKNSCGRFSDISTDVDNLLQSKRHVGQVLGILQNFLGMESKVEELTAKLSDEDEIFDVYKKIKIMNYMRTQFLQKIENGQPPSANAKDTAMSASSKLLKIREHFSAVRELEKQFQEQVIQGNLMNTHNLAKKNPSLLIKVLRVIENEEFANASISQKFNKDEMESKKQQTFDMLGRESEPFKDQKISAINKANPALGNSGSVEKEGSLKERSMNVLRTVIKRRAAEFFSAEVEGSSSSAKSQFLAALQRAEALVTDLKYVKSSVEICFPPHYQIFQMHFNAYKRELQERFDVLLSGQQMEILLNEDPESILFFSGFVQTCQAILLELNYQDDLFLNLQIRLEEYYPRFMDHAETKFNERLQRILEEQKAQEGDKLEAYSKKKKKISYFTTLSVDIFDFMQTQLEAIQESLKGEKLIEFLKRMMEQLVSLIQYVTEVSFKFEAKNPQSLVALVIRLNDLTKIASEYSKFKDLAIQLVGQQYADRVDNILDDYFRQLIQLANLEAEIIAVYIVRSEIEQDLLLHFFTTTWRENHELMLKEVLKSAGGYMQDVFKIVSEERFSAKIAEALYTMVVDAYVERFMIAVNQRFKLKLPIDNPLLNYVYKDSQLVKTDKDKIILKKDLIEFYSKTLDQDLFEVMQQDIKSFQEFREAYKEEIMQSKFNKKIQLLSIVSLMVNSTDEGEFASYEEQFWQLIASQGDEKSIVVAPGGININGSNVVRICRKMKTKNGTQKGFFKKTKLKEKQQQKKKQKSAKK